MITAAHIKAGLRGVTGALGGQMRSLDELAAGANAALLQAPAGLTAKGAAAFLATMAQESAWFRTTEEYRKDGRYAPYIGRTFQQVTWRDNYRAFGKWCKARGLVDDAEQFVDDPRSLADYRWAWLGGVWYFEHARLWDEANAGDFLGVAKGVNLGNPKSPHTPAGWPTRKRAYDAFRAVGDALLPAVAPVDPPPVLPPPVVAPAPVVDVVKPDRGSKTTWVRVNARGAIVTTGGYRITTRTLAMHLEACRLFRHFGGGTPPGITQGGRNAGGVAQSAGTHDREALDWSTKDLNGWREDLWELCLWVVGFASWQREFIAGPRGWPRHDHGIPKGGDLSRGAADQVKDFARGRDGLVSDRVYPRIGKMGVGSWTWEDYLDAFTVSFPELLAAISTRSKSTAVKRLQWALTCLLRRDVIADGDPGPVTRAAIVEAVGGLTVEALAKLGLPTSTPKGEA